jgi:hypothetical protein
MATLPLREDGGLGSKIAYGMRDPSYGAISMSAKVCKTSTLLDMEGLGGKALSESCNVPRAV